MKKVDLYELIGLMAAEFKSATNQLPSDEAPEVTKIVEEKMLSAKEHLRKLYPTYNALLEYTAHKIIASEGLSENIFRVLEDNISSDDFKGFAESIDNPDSNIVNENLMNFMASMAKDVTSHSTAYHVNRVKTEIKAIESVKGQENAAIRHGAPGGSRDKREKIREIWATGKYESRDVCAEQECAALGMSFSTARKALRNTPDQS